MAHIIRTITVVVLLVVLLVATQTAPIEPVSAESSPITTPSPVSVGVSALSGPQQELVGEAQGLFTAAGFDLPAVSIEFPTDPDACFDNGGVYIPKLRTVRMCRPSLKTMVHELAHAWLETTLSADDRQEFLDVRELDAWVGGDQWDERGAEHAAEIMTWGVMDTDISVPWIYTDSDGSTYRSTRLFKIPNSEHLTLVSAYEELTGKAPYRRLIDPRPARGAIEQVTSPEVR